MNELKILLSKVERLHQKNFELNQREAQGFNIFSLLFKSGDEVNLHSKFIYELLNIHGSHHQGTLFLDLFLEELKIDISTKNLLVFKEKYNIDILLQSPEKAILIENKIYTQDHSLQLSRYINKISNEGYKKENITLIYLTLFGHAPTEKEMENKVTVISYRKNIVHWLERSIKAVETIPILRETIKQYLNLIKELTYQSTQKGLIMDVKNFLLQESNLQRVIELEKSVIEAKIEVQLKFWQRLLSELIPYYRFDFYNTNNNKGLKSSIRRYYQQQKNTKDYGVKYQIDENLYFFIELRKNLYYGFEFIDENLITTAQRDAMNILNIEWHGKSDTIYWKYSDKRLNFKEFNHQNIFDLINDESGERDIKRISNEVIGLIGQYERGSLCSIK